MRAHILSIIMVAGFLFGMTATTSAQGQEDKYKVIQGLGYLHTQVTLLLNNWEVHPLNDIPLEEVAEEYYDHFLEEFEHDEEWVEFMMVEDNLLEGFGEDLDMSIEDAIDENLIFYDEVYKIVKKPGLLTKQLADYKKKLKEADQRLYGKIYPALIR